MTLSIMRNLCILVSSLVYCSLSQAAGFALTEQNASGLGNAYAGAAASAEDASTVFFNPAGMRYLPDNQLVLSINFINPTAHFDNNGSTAAGSQTLGTEGNNASHLTFFPNFYYAKQVNDNMSVGLGVNTPFGLATEYDADWMGRFQALKSELKTININPAIAFQASDKLSLGFGVSAMYISSTLSRAVNLGGGNSTSLSVKGDDWGYGFNFGGIFQATAETRIGLAYRSMVRQHLSGRASSPSALAALNADVTANINLPESVALSVFSKWNEDWDILADATWTNWSRFQELKVLYTNGTALTTIPENWQNTMRYSVGCNYHYHENLKLRAGLAYDQEAIQDQYRTARIPGNDRTWLSLGATYQYNQQTRLDAGYAYLFMKDAGINDNQTAAGNGNLVGVYHTHINILSVQLTHNF